MLGFLVINSNDAEMFGSLSYFCIHITGIGIICIQYLTNFRSELRGKGVHGAMGRRVDPHCVAPLSYFSCNKGRGMYYPV